MERIFTNVSFYLARIRKTILINGIAPEADDRYKKEIKKALETLVYEVDKQVDPYEALAYTIDPSGNQLKLAQGCF